MAARLYKTGLDFAQVRRRNAGNQRPVDLARVAMAEGGGQRLRGCPRSRQNQYTRGILVQPVHQSGLFIIAKAQSLGQAIHVFGGATAPLHRQPVRLVQHDDIVVFVDHAVADHLGIRFRDPPLFRRDRLVISRRQRRHAHGLPGLNTGAGLDPATVNAKLTLAAHLLDAALADMWEQAPQPAVHALVRILFGDGDCLNAAHAKTPLAAIRPKNRPPTDSPTDSTI